MGKVLTVVSTGEGNLYVEETKIDGAQRFRWRCFCRQKESWSTNRGNREIWTTFEALRQHWASVHPVLCENILINWYEVHKQVPWMLDQNIRDDDGRWWSEGFGTYKQYVDKFVGREATVQLTNLNTGAVSTVTGASVSYHATPAYEEEKKGMSRLSDIEARLRELEKEAAKYARFPKTDEWPVGTVITYSWSPSPNDAAEVFTYAVLKATATKWYWTGAWRNGHRNGDYDVLVESLADDNVSDIRVATPEDFDPLFPELEDLVGLEDTKTVEEVSAKLADKGIYVPVVKRAEG